MSRFTTVSILMIALTGIALGQESLLQKLGADLRRQPFSEALINEDLRVLTPELIELVSAEFRNTSDYTKEGRKKKQALAATLCRVRADHGDCSSYLAQLAQEAIDSDAPPVPLLDKDGQEIRGKISPLFEEWATKHNMSVGAAAERELFTYPADVLRLSSLEDPKFIHLFRRGVASRNLGVAAASISALGRLNDLASLPAILAAEQNGEATPRVYQAFALGLMKFENPAAVNEIRRIFAGTPVIALFERYKSTPTRRSGQ